MKNREDRQQYAIIKHWLISGLECVLVLRTHLCRLDEPPMYCGYVRIPANHPLYGLDYMSAPMNELDVHGSITYAEKGLPVPTLQSDPEGFWIGFDCAHMSSFEVGFLNNPALIEQELVLLATQVAGMATSG